MAHESAQIVRRGRATARDGTSHPICGIDIIIGMPLHITMHGI